MRRVHPLTYPVARNARDRAPKLFARRYLDWEIEILVQLELHSSPRPAPRPSLGPLRAAPGKAELVPV